MLPQYLQKSPTVQNGRDDSSTFTSRFRQAAAFCAVVTFVVVNLLGQTRQESRLLLQQSIDDEPYLKGPGAPLLVRCSWGAHSGSNAASRNAEEEANSAQKPNLPFGVSACPREVCAHENSHKAYGNFLFHQAVAAERRSSDLSNYDTTLRSFVHDPVQCLFLTTSVKEMCHCRYSTFEDFCHRTHYSDEVSLELIGDSTMCLLKKNMTRVCREHVLPPASPPKSNTKTKVVVYNDKTLHQLYLPFSRETDVPSKAQGYDRALQSAPTSVPNFWRNFDKRLEEVVDTHEEGTLFVYMANNEVCEDVYTDEYQSSVEFLKNNPNPAVMRQVQKRRSVDGVVNWGFTLDYYGSHLVRKLSKARLKERWPRFVYFPLDATYPAACVLTESGDGRHFKNPSKEVVSFYTAKARILWHLIETHLPRDVVIKV